MLVMLVCVVQVGGAQSLRSSAQVVLLVVDAMKDVKPISRHSKPSSEQLQFTDTFLFE
jgi:hypothetical protein